MRTTALLVALGFAACPLLASSIPAQPQHSRPGGSTTVVRGDSGSAPLLRLMAKLREQQAGASAITNNQPARAVLIPVAANAPGVNGSHFRSDVTVVFHNVWSYPDGKVKVIWIPEGNVEGAAEFTLAMEGWNVWAYPDFVGTTLGLSGTGALVFVPVSDTGDPYPERVIDVYARIWTPAAGGAPGTVSLQIPGLDVAGLFTDHTAWITGLRLGGEWYLTAGKQFRANYGILNLSDTELTFDVILNPHVALGAEILERIAVRPGELLRKTLPVGETDSWFSTYPVLEIRSIGNRGKSWTAYASSTDNVTGDGWVSLASRLPRMEDEQ
jgi:hypothetical protein